MELLLIRHAESEANVESTEDLDSPITELGREQTLKTAEWLKDNFDLSEWQGITSPYLRTLETAKIFQLNTGLRFSVNGGVREFHIDQDREPLTEGGMKIPKRSVDYPRTDWPVEHWNKRGNFYPNETLDVFIERIKLFISTLSTSGKHVIVSHGGPTRVTHDLSTGKDIEYLKTRYAPKGQITEASEIGKAGSFSNSSLTYIIDGECKFLNKVVY